MVDFLDGFFFGDPNSPSGFLASPASQIGLRLLANTGSDDPIPGIFRGVLGGSAAADEIQRRALQTRADRLMVQRAEDQQAALSRLVGGPERFPVSGQTIDFSTGRVGQSPQQVRADLITAGGDAAVNALVQNALTPRETFTTEVRDGVPVQVSSTTGREVPSPRATDPSDTLKVVGQQLVDISNPKTPTVVLDGNQSSGPLAGKSLDAQFFNILQSGASRLANGEALDPDFARIYTTARKHLSQPRVTIDPATQQQTIVAPDLSQFPDLSQIPNSVQSVARQVPPQAAAATQQPVQAASQPSGTTQQRVGGSTVTVTPPQNLDAAAKRQFRTQEQKFSRINTAINTYDRLISKHGAEVIPSAAKTELQAAYNDALLELKELFNLGVLNGPDLMLMQNILIDPTSFRGRALEAFSGRQVFKAQINLMRAKLAQARKDARGLFRQGQFPVRNDQPLNTSGNGQGAAATDEAIVQQGDELLIDPQTQKRFIRRGGKVLEILE